MRRFTKEHNDLNWLFPDPTNYTNDKLISESWFDTYEDLSLDLLKTCYGEQETFTKDDMIDAFMKGASEAHAFLSGQFDEMNSLLELHHQSIESSKRLNKLLEELINKSKI